MRLKILNEDIDVLNSNLNDQFMKTYNNVVNTIFQWISDTYKDEGVFSISLLFERDDKSGNIVFRVYDVQNTREILLRNGLMLNIIDLVNRTYRYVKENISPKFCYKTFTIEFNGINSDNPNYSIKFTYDD